MAYAQKLPEFTAVYKVNVAGFNIGTGTHHFSCQAIHCTLKSNAKPSGFIRNFFKDELYETAKIRQTEDSFLWQSYLKREIKYKGDEVREKITEIQRQKGQIVYPDKNRIFADSAYAFDPMSIAYAIQWLNLNQYPKSQYDKLKLQTHKLQSVINFQDFKINTQLSLDFGKSKFSSQVFKLQTANYGIRLWLLKDFDWLPGKIEIYNKNKARTITLELARPPVMHRVQKAHKDI